MGILVILLSAIAYAMVAKRLSKTPVTAPMVFLLVGVLMAHFNLMRLHEAEHILHLIAEVTLIVLLFLDAAKIDVKTLIHSRIWPLRMLLIGLPLSVLFGTLLASLIFPDYSIALMALIAAIMAPTDAALGQAVVTNEQVPQDERQSLTVESGLNDGMALPIILILASMVLRPEEPHDTTTNWYQFTLLQLALGPVVGATLGLVGPKRAN